MRKHLIIAGSLTGASWLLANLAEIVPIAGMWYAVTSYLLGMAAIAFSVFILISHLDEK